MVTTHGDVKFFYTVQSISVDSNGTRKLSRLTWGSFCITLVEKSKYHVYVKQVSGAIIVQRVDCEVFLVTV